MPKRHPRVIIIGGGLAGMVVAKELAERGIGVTIVEASDRLGGKAGSDWHQLVDVNGATERVAIDHGFHFFPGWYRNTRKLLRDLGIDQHLLDADSFYMIRKPEHAGDPSRVYRTRSFDSLQAAFQNIFGSILPWHQALVAFYFTLDLAAEPFRLRGFLDRVSVSGFFRSRFYRNEAIAAFHQMSVLQASAIPLYELSAMSFQKVVKAFAWTPAPFVSMLDGDLQTRFIDPFRRHLEQHGVEIHLEREALALKMDGQRVCAHDVNDPHPLGKVGDIFVLATPPEITVRLAALPGSTAEPTVLPGVSRLESAPMAAMQVYFDRRLEAIPPWHTSLYQSAYGLSLIDVSQHWPSLVQRGKTVLSVIAAHMIPLRALSEEAQAREVLRDLMVYLTTNERGERVIDYDPNAPIEVLERGEGESESGLWIRAGAITLYWRANVDAPLFLNTTGAWEDRPEARTAIENLFVAGDYCRTQADLTTMESAVMSGLATASEILRTLGKDESGAEPLQLSLPPRWMLLALKYALLPVILPIGAAYAAQRAWEDVPLWGERDA